MMPSTFAIFVLFFPLINISASEPECSKYHYEEKLLEKMIRLEMSVEAMKKDIEHSQHQVTTALDNLQKERTTWDETLQAKSNKISTDLAAVILDTKTKVVKEMKTFETEKEKWHSKLKDVVKVPQVLFSARDPKQTSLHTNLVMVFKKVLLNEGTAYNKENGIFTAPFNGVYTFSVQLCVYPGKYVDFAFMANDKPFLTSRINRHSSSNFSCNNYDAMTILRLNDQVTIKVVSSSSGTIISESLTHHWNMFSGRLIYTTKDSIQL